MYVLFVGMTLAQRKSKRNLGFKIGITTDCIVFPEYF